VVTFTELAGSVIPRKVRQQDNALCLEFDRWEYDPVLFKSHRDDMHSLRDMRRGALSSLSWHSRD